MPDEFSAYTAILVIAVVTFVTRFCGPVLMLTVRPSAKVERFLEALPASVIAALVATVVIQAGLREAVVVVVAALVMLAIKNKTWAMIAGMVLAAGWTAGTDL